MEDWYDKAKEEFLFDLAAFNDAPADVTKRVYQYLIDIGVVDYDIEKEYLYSEYREIE